MKFQTYDISNKNRRCTRQVFIEPGEYYVTGEQEILSTILGSCIAVCLFDPINKIIGMNHFLLAYRNKPNQSSLLQSEAGRYGIYSMELLINALIKIGGDRRHLRAKCFGGGNVLSSNSTMSSQFAIGDNNVRFIREFLKTERIPISAASLGGNMARRIYFMPDDYSVYMKATESEQIITLKKTEQQYLEKTLLQRNTAGNHIDYW